MDNLTRDLLKWKTQDPRSLSINKKTESRSTKTLKRHTVELVCWGQQKNNVLLTRSEIYTLLLLENNLTHKIIGKIMGLSGRTIEYNIRNIKFKAGVKNLQELIHDVKQQFKLGDFKEITLKLLD